MPPPEISLADFYNLVMGKRGVTLALHHRALCAALEDRRIANLLVIGPMGLGKSTLLSVAYPTWRLGVDPTLTILGISAGEALIATFMRAMMEIIAHSPVFHECFPKVRPDPSAGWSVDRGVFVSGREPGDQDASFFLTGLKSKSLTGVHAREIICDDIHDEENSRTPELRAGVVQTFYRTILGRADPRGARFVVVGRRWARDDVYGELMREGGWTVMRIPAERQDHGGSLWWDVATPPDEKNIFTEGGAELLFEDSKTGVRHWKAIYGIAQADGFYWPKSRQKRRDYFRTKKAQPRVAAIAYNGDDSAGEGGVFEPGDFHPYVPPQDLPLGIASPHVKAWIASFPSSPRVVEAWDTATGKSPDSALTAALAGLIVPCREWHRGEDPSVVGPCDFHHDVYLLDLYAENVDFRQLVMALRARHAKWGANPVLVEDKSSGVSLIQTMRTVVPLRPLKVVEGKIERAVNGVGGGPWSVQGWGRMGRLFIPAGAPWVEGFIEKVCSFTGDQTGRADEFDTLVHLVTWAIMKSTATARFPQQQATLLQSPPIVEHPLSTLSQIQLQSPFAGMCGAPCRHYGVVANAEWCSAHGRRTSAIGGCDRWEG